MLSQTNYWHSKTKLGALIFILLLSLPFVLYALKFGVRGLSEDLTEETYLYTPDQIQVNVALFSHMICGALLTLLTPLQLIAQIRQRFPRVHRQMGYLAFGLAIICALGGIYYIVQRGCIGGPVMDVGFSLYGTCVLVSALQAVRYARSGNYRYHREWALRLFVLAMGSWLFRVHYAVWFALTDGLGSTPDLTGPFDQVQVFAFFLPYLAWLEWYLRKRQPAQSAP